MKIRNKNNGEFLSIKSIIDAGIGRFNRTDAFTKNGIELIENTPEEIKAATIEMDERLKGTWQTEVETKNCNDVFGHFTNLMI